MHQTPHTTTTHHHHHLNAELAYTPFLRRNWYDSYDTSDCSAAHLCLWPPQVPPARARAGPPQLEILEVLAREGNLDVNARDLRGRTPLFWVPRMASGHEEAVDLLVALGADVNAQSSTGIGSGPNDTPLIAMLQKARSKYQVPCLRKLVAAGAQTAGIFGAKGHTPLATAARFGNAKAVRFFLAEAGVSAVERNPVSDETALHAAFYSESSSLAPTCALLLDAGVDANAVDNQGRTPIFGCAMPTGSSRLQALRLLLDGGASADVADDEGLTPLLVICSCHFMIQYCRDVVDEILRHSSVHTRRADNNRGDSAVDCIVDQVRERGFTPEQQQLIVELLFSGAPVHARNAAFVLPIAVSHALPLAARNEAELAARRSEARRCWAREDVVGLAQNVQELRDVEQMVAAKRRRLEELEGEFGGSSGTDSSGGGGGDEGEDMGEEGDTDHDESGGGDGSGGEGVGSDDDGEGDEQGGGGEGSE